jgi:hypothetical protein
VKIVSDRDSLHHAIRGDVREHGDAEYDAARQVWNATVDRRPR